MKKAALIFAALILAVLMLPGILQPPAESTADNGSEVKQLARALDLALLEYRQEFGRFPEGQGGEIISALRGKNERGKTFLVLNENSAVNELGEMLDPWGTPFRITFAADATVPKIHSAGPNLIFEEKATKRSGDDYYSWHDPALKASPLPF